MRHESATCQAMRCRYRETKTRTESLDLRCLRAAPPRTYDPLNARRAGADLRPMRRLRAWCSIAPRATVHRAEPLKSKAFVSLSDQGPWHRASLTKRGFRLRAGRPTRGSPHARWSPLRPRIRLFLTASQAAMPIECCPQ